MSNESVQHHLAEKAKEPTFVRPRLEYIEFFEKHTRAACNVAQVYSFLVFRCQRNKPGDVQARLEVIREGGRWGERAFWYLHTADDIAVECYGDRKAKHKVQGALEILKRLKMIEAQRGRHPINGEVVKYRGKSVLHIRLGVCQRGNGLDAWPTTEQMTKMRTIPVLAGADTSVLAGADTLVQDASEEGDTEEETSNADSQALPETPNKIQCIQAKATGEAKSKTEASSTPTLNAVEKKISEIFPTYVPDDWVEAFLATGGTLTAHERGRLIGVGTKYEQAGKPFAAFLKVLLGHSPIGVYVEWSRYRANVLAAAGKSAGADAINPATYRPHVDFFLRRHEALYEQYRQLVLGEGYKEIGWKPPLPTIIAPSPPAKPLNNEPNKFLKAALKNNAEKAAKAKEAA